MSFLDFATATCYKLTMAKSKGNNQIAPLRAWRMSAGLTQAELASAAGVGQTVISAIENPPPGISRWGVKAMRRIASALELDIQQIEEFNVRINAQPQHEPDTNPFRFFR